MMTIEPPIETPVRAALSNGVELHFIERGTGPAVVMLHGGMGDLTSWIHLVGTLSQQQRAIAYSRRNHSPNRNGAATPSAAVADDVADLLALQSLLRTGPAHLVGASYGALVALAFALAHPGRVLSLVLAEPPLHRWARTTASGDRLYSGFIEEVWRPAAEAFGLGHERRALQLLTDGMWGRPTFECLSVDRVDTALRNVAAMKALTRSLDPFPDLDRAAVAQVAVPVLLVQGEHTSELHRHVMDQLSNTMRHSTRVEIASAGHASPIENPTRFDAEVLAFLRSVHVPTGVFP